jgi:hypothetical protein
MRATIVLALALAACATGPERSEFHQGAMRPPPPPAFSPTTDAPHTVGQPGHVPGVRVAPQPQPKPKRLLPPTREPGIWATNAPDAPSLSDDGKPAPLILGERLPYTNLQDEPEERDHTRECAAKADRALRAELAPEQITGLTPEERACLAAKAATLCAKYIWDPAPMDETLTSRERAIFRLLSLQAQYREEDKCKGSGETERVRTAFTNAEKQWRELFR